MAAGPRPIRIPMSAWRPRAPRSPGTSVLISMDEQVGGADIHGGIISVPADGLVPVHWHDEVGEIQFVMAGQGLLLDAAGRETPVGPHDLVFAPPGPHGAHGFRNASSFPLVMLFFYPSPGGKAPTTHFVDEQPGH